MFEISSEDNKSVGQMSLNYVVVMIILLVVAGVVIGIVRGRLNIPLGPSPREAHLDKIKQKCRSSCRDYERDGSNQYLREYCTKDLEHDYSGDGLKQDLVIEGGTVIWENDVRCFNIEPCSHPNGDKIEVSDCVAALCNEIGNNNTVYNLLKPKREYDPSSPGSIMDSVREEDREAFRSGLDKNNWYTDLINNPMIKDNAQCY